MKDLLICVAHHHSPERLPFLLQVLAAFAEYELDCHIVIDTQVEALYVAGENIEVVSHTNLEHVFHLTWVHRQHIKNRIEDYRYFLYVEDDMLLPFENFIHYQRNFERLWPNFVPGFVRIEEWNGEEWLVDQTERQQFAEVQPGFVALNPAYHGFWLLPQEALKANMRSDFARLDQSRETAASYAIWELQKTALVELDGRQISRKCFSYHVSNKYAPCPTLKNAKIKVADIFL